MNIPGVMPLLQKVAEQQYAQFKRIWTTNHKAGLVRLLLKRREEGASFSSYDYSLEG